MAISGMEDLERIVREKEEAEQRLEALLAEARGLGRVFPEFRASLDASPEYIVFDCQLASVNFRYYTSSGNNRVYRTDAANADVLVALTDKIRSELLRVAALSELVSGQAHP